MISDEIFPFYDFHVVSCAGEIWKTRPMYKSARLKLRLGISFISSSSLSQFFVLSREHIFASSGAWKVRREKKRGKDEWWTTAYRKNEMFVSAAKNVCVWKEFQRNQLLVGLKINEREKKLRSGENDAVVEFPSWLWFVFILWRNNFLLCIWMIITNLSPAIRTRTDA